MKSIRKKEIAAILILLIAAGLFYLDGRDRDFKEYRTKLQTAEEAWQAFDQEMEALLDGKAVPFETFSRRYTEAMSSFAKWGDLIAEDGNPAAAQVNTMELQEIGSSYIELADFYYAVCDCVYFPELEPETEPRASKKELIERREKLQGRLDRSFENLAADAQ